MLSIDFGLSRCDRNGAATQFPLFLRGDKGVFLPSVQNKGERRTPPAPSYEEGEIIFASSFIRKGKAISFPLFLRREKGVFLQSVQNKGERRTPPAPSYEEGE